MNGKKIYMVDQFFQSFEKKWNKRVTFFALLE